LYNVFAADVTLLTSACDGTGKPASLGELHKLWDLFLMFTAMANIRQASAFDSHIIIPESVTAIKKAGLPQKQYISIFSARFLFAAPGFSFTLSESSFAHTG